jgi:hypothetical protein
MVTITTRSGKGSPLTNNEVDANFTNLNTGTVQITSATGSSTVPAGTTAQRDGSPAIGMFRYNTTLDEFEGYTDGGWIGIGDGLDSATVLSIAASKGISITAGAGLTGGGTLASTRDLAIGAGTGITVNANDIATNDGAIVHDNLSGFVANEHIDHTSVSVVAGTGLTGGGTIAANRTLNVIGGVGIDAAADDIHIDSAELIKYYNPQLIHDNLSGFVANEHIDHSGVNVVAGAGLTGGGSIAASRTINVIGGTGITANADNITTTDSEIVHDNLSGFVANEHIDHSGVTITAGTGLTGGGTIAATRTINVVGGTGITANANEITTTDGEIVHDNLSGFVANEHIDHSGVSITAGIGLKGGGTIAATRDLAIDSAEFLANYNASIVHDNLSGFVANEHIDHSGVSILAGDGLTGGGTIGQSRSLDIGAGTGITVNDNDIATNDGAIVHDNLSGFVANEHIDHSGVSVTAGTGLTGGGTIAATRTINVIGGTGITANANDIATNDGEIVHDNLSGFVANEHIDHTGVTLTAGAGLTGGGTIAANRTFTVGAGTGVTVNANDVAIGQSVATNADFSVATVTTTGNVLIGGNLQVDGTRTIINSSTVQIDDKTFMIGDSAADSSGMNAGGIELSTTGGANPSILYYASGDKFQTNKNWDVQGNVVLTGTVDGVDVAGLQGRSIVAGAGMTGGGTLAASRTLNVIAGTGITVNADNITTNDGAIVHDNLSGFVADEHVAHGGVNIVAGAGMTGGGTIAASRTLNVIAGTGITVNADNITTNDGAIVHDNLSGFVANEHIDHTGVSITAGAGLTGGGTIASTRDIAVGAGTGITVNANDIATNDGAIVHDNLSGFVADEHVAHGGVTITAGAGMTGGGTIAASRTLNVIAGTGITVNANDIATNDGAIVHNNLSGYDADRHIDHSAVSISAGVGLSGGGTIAANRTLTVDLSELTDMTAAVVGSEDELILLDNGADRRKLISEITLSDFNNDVGWTTNVGDITGVTAGAGMTGGGSSGTVTVNAIAGTGITVNADNITTNDGAIVHDNLSGFVANEHIDHTGVSVVAGAGMTGGGTIAARRTLNVIAGTGITVNADNITTNDGAIVHDNLSGFVADEHVAHGGVSVTAGAGMTGGGTIAASRTLNVIAGTGITVNANSVQTNDGAIVHDNLSGFVSAEHVNHGSITFTAGTGMTGGGTLAANRTFNVAGVTSSMFSSASTVLIKNAAGSTLKTIRSPGS